MLSLKIVIVSFCAASALEIKQAENQEAPGGKQRVQKIPAKAPRGVPSEFGAYPGQFFHKTAKNSSAMIFVINRDEHLEQCGCMQAQLGRHSPYQILRQTAVTQATHSHLCPKIPNKDEDDNNYCTNSLIAQKVKTMQNKPDFVIIMQDTLLLQTKGAVHFWSEMSHFLNQANNEATCKKAWDHLAIDPHSDKPSKAQCMHANSCAKLGRSGTCMSQIIICRSSEPQHLGNLSTAKCITIVSRPTGLGTLGIPASSDAKPLICRWLNKAATLQPLMTKKERQIFSHALK